MKLISRKKTEILELAHGTINIRAGQILKDFLKYDCSRRIKLPSRNFRRHAERVIREAWNEALGISPLLLYLVWQYLESEYKKLDEHGIYDDIPVPYRNAGFLGGPFERCFGCGRGSSFRVYEEDDRENYSTTNNMHSIYLLLFAMSFNMCMARLEVMQQNFREAVDVCLNDENVTFQGKGYTAAKRYALYAPYYGDRNPLWAAEERGVGWCRVAESKENLGLQELVCHEADNIIGLCCAQFSRLVENDMRFTPGAGDGFVQINTSTPPLNRLLYVGVLSLGGPNRAVGKNTYRCNVLPSNTARVNQFFRTGRTVHRIVGVVSPFDSG